MKSLFVLVIDTMLLMGCAKPPPPNISIHSATENGNIKAVKQHFQSQSPEPKVSLKLTTPSRISKATDSKLNISKLQLISYSF